MPTLVIEHAQSRRGGVITGRVLIGRLPTNGIVLKESNISRLHAWIGQADGHYFVRDCGSLTGTFINGQAVERQSPLADRDVLKIGAALVTFLESDDLPPGVTNINLAGKPPLADIDTAGILFDCVCGAPHWTKANAAGQTHECDSCGRSYVVPTASGTVARPLAEEPPEEPQEQPQPQQPTPQPPPNSTEAVETAETVEPIDAIAPEPAAPEPLVATATPPDLFEAENFANPALETAAVGTCSICQSDITKSDRMHTCPSCGLTFHEECWIENQGCSAYGCPQVKALAPPPEDYVPPPRAEEPLAYMPAAISQPEPGFPWEFVFLGLSVVGSLVGAFFFGVPAAAVAIGTFIYLIRFKGPRRQWAVWTALILSLLGCAAGVFVSNYYLFGSLLGKWAHR